MTMERVGGEGLGAWISFSYGHPILHVAPWGAYAYLWPVYVGAGLEWRGGWSWFIRIGPYRIARVALVHPHE